MTSRASRPSRSTENSVRGGVGNAIARRVDLGGRAAAFAVVDHEARGRDPESLVLRSRTSTGRVDRSNAHVALKSRASRRRQIQDIDSLYSGPGVPTLNGGIADNHVLPDLVLAYRAGDVDAVCVAGNRIFVDRGALP